MAAPSLPEHPASDASRSSRSITAKDTIAEASPRFQTAPKRMELVNVTLAKEDYEKLKAVGGLNCDYIEKALTRYIHVLKDMTFRRDPECWGWGRGPVVIFPCAVPKDIADKMRNLPGRFDEHAIEAIRLLFREDGTSAGPTIISPKSRLKSALSRGVLFSTYTGLVFFASRLLRLIDNLSIVNR